MKSSDGEILNAEGKALIVTIQAYKEQNHQAALRITVLEEELKEATNKSTQFAEEARLAKAVSWANEGELKRLREQTALLERTVEDMTRQQQAAQATMDELTNTLSQSDKRTEAALQTQEQEIARIRELNASLGQTLKDTKEQLEESHRTVEELRSDLGQKQESFASQKEQLEEAHRTVVEELRNDLIQKEESFASQLATLKEQLEGSHTGQLALAQAQEELAQAQNTVKLLEAKVAEVTAQATNQQGSDVSRLTELNGSLEQSLEETKEQLVGAQTAVNDLMDALAAKDKSHSEEVEQLQNRLEQLQSLANNAVSAGSASVQEAAEVKRISSTLADTSRQLFKAQSAANDLRATLADKEQEYRDSIAKERSRVSALEAELKSLGSKCAELEQAAQASPEPSDKDDKDDSSEELNDDEIRRLCEINSALQESVAEFKLAMARKDMTISTLQEQLREVILQSCGPGTSESSPKELLMKDLEIAKERKRLENDKRLAEARSGGGAAEDGQRILSAEEAAALIDRMAALQLANSDLVDRNMQVENQVSQMTSAMTAADKLKKETHLLGFSPKKVAKLAKKKIEGKIEKLQKDIKEPKEPKEPKEAKEPSQPL